MLRHRAAATLITAIALLSLAGCARLMEQPEISPNRWAPRSVEHEWIPAPAVTKDFTLAEAAPYEAAPVSPAVQARTAPPYDLTGLIDIALRNNPRTRRAWEAARSAAANFGAARAPYYPLADAEAINGYMRTPFELPGAIGTIQLWQAQPVIEMAYTLFDFGRRRSAAEAAQDRLIAADFSFNRAVQDVVFSTQTAFYTLDEAAAAVTAAQQNLKLARTDFDSVDQRLNHGLATEPELLLAKQRVAQSQFDLANARLLVHDAQANLAVALGVPANREIRVDSLRDQTVPESLGDAVDKLIAQARRERPDLAADVANLRASNAQIASARAQFFPAVALSANYGESLWNYTFKGPPAVRTGQPQYSALLTLKWDIFTGFKRLNDVRRAEADREAASAELKSLELNAIAEVWRSYYEFRSSRSKYDYAQSLLAASQESYAANSETYRQGLSTIVELLTAERDLANARYILIQSKAELLTAYAAVAYAAGAVRTPG
ncbi:MAG: TolC family protein [Candidatus Binataceae bacterium]